MGRLQPRTHLQDAAADVAVTGLALDAELGVVVGLTVRDAIPWERDRTGERRVSPWSHPRPRGQPGSVAARWHSLADVLAGEDDPARLALEAADVPLLLQGQQGLALLDLLLAAGAVWGTGGEVGHGRAAGTPTGHSQLLGHPGCVTWHSPHTLPRRTFPGMTLLQTPCPWGSLVGIIALWKPVTPACPQPGIQEESWEL